MKQFLINITIVIGIGLAFYMSTALNTDANASRPKDVIKVAAIGDSITYNTSDEPDGLAEHSYTPQLQELLGDKYRVLNYGASGRTLLNSGDRPYRDTDLFAFSQAINPNIVLIMLGTNDSKTFNWNAEEYESQLKDFVATYKKLSSHPKVYLMTPPSAYDNTIDIQKTVIQSEVAPIVRRVAQQTDTSLIDIFSATKDHSELFPDGIHPNEAGYDIITKTVYDALMK